MGPTVTPQPRLEAVPLGGVGEFGMNMMAFAYGDTAVLVDAGVMFPGPELFGVDLVIPDLSYLEQSGRRVSALVLTHGHEDHIGAVPYVWPVINGPIFGTALTLALLEPKLHEHGIDPGDRLVTIEPRQTVAVGPLEIEFIRVTHSMPDCVAVALHTPVGTILHTGDFKIDQTPPDGEPFDLHRFAALGEAGVLALFADSTNIERPGYSGSELDVIEAFEEIFSSTTGKLVVTTFARSLHRVQVLIDLAVRFDRKVAFIGRGMVETVKVGQRLDRLRIPTGLRIRDQDVGTYDPGNVLCITTGSQGEPLSALSRIAIDDYRHVAIGSDDVVVFSARAIPGNRRAIGRVMNHIARRGAEVIHEDDKCVHVSGHGNAEELKLVTTLVRPRYFVPIHGEYRYLTRHAKVAERVTGGAATVLLAENGDRICFEGERGWIEERVTAGRVLIDSSGTGEIGDEVIRDRRHLAGDGLVVTVVAINRQEGTLDHDPEVITRGFVVDDATDKLLGEVPRLIRRIFDGAGAEERGDASLIKARLRIELQRFFRKRSGRRPLVLPVIMET